MVPKAGLEPARPLGRGILNPLRLPFRHLGMDLRLASCSDEVKRQNAQICDKDCAGAFGLTLSLQRPPKGKQGIHPAARWFHHASGCLERKALQAPTSLPYFHAASFWRAKCCLPHRAVTFFCIGWAVLLFPTRTGPRAAGPCAANHRGPVARRFDPTLQQPFRLGRVQPYRRDPVLLRPRSQLSAGRGRGH